MHRLVLGLVLLCFWSAPALAYQVKITQKNVPFNQQPDLRTKEIDRLSPQAVRLLQCRWGGDAELWCLIEAKSQQGWAQARYLDLNLSSNFPLRLVDVPGVLFFEQAQRELIYARSKEDKAAQNQLQRTLLMMDIGLLKQRWESLKARQNFLDISRRIGVSISQSEYQALKSELSIIEKRFQRQFAQLQRRVR